MNKQKKVQNKKASLRHTNPTCFSKYNKKAAKFINNQAI